VRAKKGKGRRRIIEKRESSTVQHKICVHIDTSFQNFFSFDCQHFISELKRKKTETY
jgi:hypothetical protein